jgi:hypothetical protein
VRVNGDHIKIEKTKVLLLRPTPTFLIYLRHSAQTRPRERAVSGCDAGYSGMLRVVTAIRQRPTESRQRKRPSDVRAGV